MKHMLIRSCLLGAGLAPLFLAGPLAAQSLSNNHSVQRATAGETKEAPPPALPGSQVNPPSAAPSNHASADMQPNDALFDAINRGDLVSARDAINRGADLGARNVLGMSPLELSVDLGRNDITFLLLSMRGSDDTDAQAHRLASTPPPQAVAAASHTGKTRTARNSAALRDVHVTVPDEAEAASADQLGDHPQTSSPDQGGTPKPQDGFLGFGGP